MTSRFTYRINPGTFVILVVFFMISVMQSCVEPIHPYKGIAPGTWRGVLYIEPNKSVTPGIQQRYRQDFQMHESNDIGILPFLFDVKYENDTTWYMVIQNGEEKIELKDISLGRTKGDADMQLRAEFVEFDAHIEAIVKEGVMQGHYILHNKTDYRIPFAAFYGADYRFVTPANPKEPVDIDGKWEVTFASESDKEYPAIGEFEQTGNKLTGTFLTQTGDYRYLEGIVDENKLWLSTFDGAHAYLFHAKLNEEGELIGVFRSGKHFETDWVARRNNSVTLRDPDSLTRLVQSDVYIEFPDANGETIQIPKPGSESIKILQIMGTWCPNCKDETEFLKNFLMENPGLPLDIYAIAFERYKDEQKAFEAISRYKEKMEIPYPIVLGGTSKKSEASKQLPFIDAVTSYPTMIILDQQNQVRRIHTGFYGPATQEYAEFKKEFSEFIRNLADQNDLSK